MIISIIQMNDDLLQNYNTHFNTYSNSRITHDDTKFMIDLLLIYNCMKLFIVQNRLFELGEISFLLLFDDDK